MDIAGGFYHSIILAKDRSSKISYKLSQDLKRLINDPSRSDVTFQGPDWKIHAHWCILFAWCKSLDTLIENEGKDSTENYRDEI